ncbi:MAG: hypothetical protein A6D92_22955 [Symbiobacterium thermophilum]|uniref:Uncharacterized protein n=1 Tax=Symbiobacterium thermophilum TaxID=2734 RepID=A0A1Y2T0X7_SYMTR|nr:MAG: hypothetical protein A6D92_22955 [Symbiobacterium thermophilum]
MGQYGTSETPQDVPGAVSYEDMYNSDEDVYTIVDPMDALVDEDGEPCSGTTGTGTAAPSSGPRARKAPSMVRRTWAASTAGIRGPTSSA